MSGLAHYLEEQGIPTVVVALVREHVEKMQPPRALWVPFSLGRPFGAPNDVTVQTRVLREALGLLVAESGPVLVDAIEPVDDIKEEISWVCPVSFAVKSNESGDIKTRVSDEMAALKPWYELGLERRGRTTVGLGSLSVEESASLLAGYIADGNEIEYPGGASEVDALRWSAGDLMSYYMEAASAQPGTDPSQELVSWFWRDTAGGEMLKQIREICLNHDHPEVRSVGDFMIVAEPYR